MGMVEEEGMFMDIGVLMAMGGFWSTMDIDMEDRGMLDRLRGSAEMP